MDSKQKIPGFDILKIVAATLIVFHHYQQVFEVSFYPVNFYGGKLVFGYLVELFFVISGFLTLYSNKVCGGGTARRFIHKLLRIYPMATIACAFTLIVNSVQAEIASLWNTKTLCANFLLIFSGWPYFSMMGINNPTWYLCVLIQCYLAFYLIEWMSGKLKINRVWFDGAMVILVFGLYRFNLVADSTYRGIGAFSVGLILCGVKDKVPKKKWIPIALLASSVALLVVFPSQQRRIATFIAFPALVILCVWWKGKISEKAEKLMELLSKMSFEVYIWHYPMMALEQMLLKISGYEFCRSYLTMIVFALVVWLLAYPLYKYIEVPINRTIRKKIS